MMISGNLYIVLVHLRLADIERRLWVDAVCINQGNVNEKNEQIPLMMDIYKHATRIVAWLGQSSNNSSIAIAAVLLLQQSNDWIPLKAEGASCSASTMISASRPLEKYTRL